MLSHRRYRDLYKRCQNGIITLFPPIQCSGPFFQYIVSILSLIYNIDPLLSVKMSSVSTAHTGTAPPGLRLDTQLLYTLYTLYSVYSTVQATPSGWLGVTRTGPGTCLLSAVWCTLHYTVWSVLCYVCWHLQTTDNGQLSLHSGFCALLFIMGWYASCMGASLGWDETVHNNRVKVSDDDFWLVLAGRGAEGDG